MTLGSHEIYFFISYAVALITFSLIAKWYVWPALEPLTPKAALTPLLLYACLRINGLMFLVPGLVSRDLPQAFAGPVAYGDATAVALALLALAALRHGNALALLLAWLFNIEGLVLGPGARDSRSLGASSALGPPIREMRLEHANRVPRRIASCSALNG